jgi:lipopolysaccharide biosynthesis glycosyltransferase
MHTDSLDLSDQEIEYSNSSSKLNNGDISGPIILVCASDNNYAMPLAVMVRSVIENLGPERSLSLFIIDGGISSSRQQKVMQSIQDERITVNWLKPQTELLSGLKGHWYITTAMFYRLLIPDLLPGLSKAIYLDTDLIVNTDLGKLWDTDLGNNYLAAAQELYSVEIEKELPHIDPFPPVAGNKDYSTFNTTFKAFNSGVLVINLDKWRQENLGLKIIRYLVEQRPYGRTTDGDGLNILLRNQWLPLDPRWNQTPGIFDYKNWRNSPFSESEFLNILNKPYIIHFAHPGKPWNTYGRHPSEALFYTYLDKTKWTGWRFTIWRRIYNKIIRELRNAFSSN